MVTRLVVGEKEVVGDRVGGRRDLEKGRTFRFYLYPLGLMGFIMMMNGVWYGL